MVGVQHDSDSTTGSKGEDGDRVLGMKELMKSDALPACVNARLDHLKGRVRRGGVMRMRESES